MAGGWPQPQRVGWVQLGAKHPPPLADCALWDKGSSLKTPWNLDTLKGLPKAEVLIYISCRRSGWVTSVSSLLCYTRCCVDSTASCPKGSVGKCVCQWFGVRGSKITP